jgi:hypothetical protein
LDAILSEQKIRELIKEDLAGCGYILVCIELVTHESGSETHWLAAGHLWYNVGVREHVFLAGIGDVVGPKLQTTSTCDVDLWKTALAPGAGAIPTSAAVIGSFLSCGFVIRT